MVKVKEVKSISMTKADAQNADPQAGDLAKFDDAALEQTPILNSKEAAELTARFERDALPLLDVIYAGALDRKSTRLNSSHTDISRMPSSA